MKPMALKEEIIEVIEKGRQTGVKSEIIADEIFNKEIEVQEDILIECPLNINDILVIAQKAIKHAEFEGAIVVLSAGRTIKMRGGPESSPLR